MSCKQKREITLFLSAVTVYLYTFQVCHSVSLGQWGDGFNTYQGQESTATRWAKVKQDEGVRLGNWHLVEKVTQGTDLRKSAQPGLQEIWPESDALPDDLMVPKVTETGNNFATNSSSWSVGKIRKQRRTSAPDSQDGYHAAYTFGFHGVQGKVLAPSFDSSPHFSEWLAMRPLVQCNEKVMTFTASGQGLTHLLVDREGASPISLFQLPPFCGYSVRTSWSDLEMMVPYDACYITQENDSYVLPMLWWGSPLKLSCPVQMSPSAPSSSLSAPSVFCSPFGMAVQIYGQEQDAPLLGVMMNDGWVPFVSEQCAYRVLSRPDELTFFISYKAPCITSGEGLHLYLLLDDKEYILSCPASPQFPLLPDPVSPAPTSPPPPPPQPPTKGHTPQLPDHPYYPYPGFQYPNLPQLYPPGPQPVHPPQPTKDGPPGPQPQQQPLYPTGPVKLPSYPGDHPKNPSPPHQAPVVIQATSTPGLSPGSISQYQSGLYYPGFPFYYPAVSPPQTPAPTTTEVPPATDPPRPPANSYYLQYYHQMPYYPQPSAAPVTQAPAPLPPNPPLPPPPYPPKQPEGPQYQIGSFYAPDFYYPYGAGAYPHPGLEVRPPPASHPSTTPPPATTTTTVVPKHPSYQAAHFYQQKPFYFLPPTPPLPGREISQTVLQEAQKPVVPQATCPPHTHAICSYYSYPYYPYYHPFYAPPDHLPHPPVPQYPAIHPPPKATDKPFTTATTTPTPTTESTTISTPTQPSPQMPHLKCLPGRMVVLLPFAHPDSIQVRDQMKAWLFLSSVSLPCGYMLQMAEGSGVILHSPLPACHSQSRAPTTISLPIRFWDLSIAQYRTLELQCPFDSTPETPVPVTPPVSPTPPSIHSHSVLKPRVICSSHQMTVELPPGAISRILLKDIKGNWMNLQDAPKHCGYSASEGKNGKIHLSLQLHSRCHMSVQGKMYIITVVYMTVNGKKEDQLSCPVLIPRSGTVRECNLPSKQRLPCGPVSVSQPQCLSMGCCFSKHPPACYYPMDECTIDRHFVFSVPASLTEPPLSPALLVAASNSTCTPQRVTSDYALFKIPMDGCGARRVKVGKMVIYMVEIINKVQAISLNYGTITRDSPIRLLVECRFQPGTVLTVSYLVKTPSLGPEVHTQGMFGVQLRIAKDAQYNSYYPQYHQPLQMLLGKPLYLEVRLLNAPDASLVLLVHFCVAYPRSGKSVWVLLYNGCPNPLDPAPQQAVVSNPHPLSQDQTRRFTISTFQFLPDGEFKDPNEEIYFMCSTEICSPRDGPCVEGCFGQ